jgi:hypothetical protein
VPDVPVIDPLVAAPVEPVAPLADADPVVPAAPAVLAEPEVPAVLPVIDPLAAVPELLYSDDEGVDWPLIAAANAVMCVRTSISLLRVASSIVDAEAPVERLPVAVPAVPVVPLVPAVAVGSALLPVVEAVPTRFVRIRSIAATSVPQLLLLADGDFVPRAGVVEDAALLDDAPAPLAEIRSRLFRCRFSSVNCARDFAGIEVVWTPSNAALAWRRCS